MNRSTESDWIREYIQINILLELPRDWIREYIQINILLELPKFPFQNGQNFAFFCLILILKTTNFQNFYSSSDNVTSFVDF